MDDRSLDRPKIEPIRQRGESLRTRERAEWHLLRGWNPQKSPNRMSGRNARGTAYELETPRLVKHHLVIFSTSQLEQLGELPFD